jgi:hypothetical protein
MKKPKQINYTKIHQKMVKKFMTMFGQWLPGRGKKKKWPNRVVQRNRIRMAMSENMEWFTATTVVDRADGIVDLWYVVLGATLEHGVKFDESYPCPLTAATFDKPCWGKQDLVDSHHVEQVARRLWIVGTTGAEWCKSVLLTTADSIAREMKTLGITNECFHELFKEVHRSNMSKLWLDKDTPYVVKDKAGKVLKPPTYSPPNLQPILEKHGVSCT